MRKLAWTSAVLSMLLATMLLSAAQPERKRSEAQIKASELARLNERLERTQRQVRKDAADEDRLAKALRDAERALSRVNGDLKALAAQRAERAQARADLSAERAQRQRELDATEADLASQVRAAYFMGRSEPLKLLLNQRNPAEFGRNLTYYGYLGRLRAGQVAIIRNNIARIDELDASIDAEDSRLADLIENQKKRLNEREDAVRQRGQVLASMREQARDRVAELRRLRSQRQQLEDLVEKLKREAQATPFDPDSPFAQRRNKLSWPVTGRIVTQYGARLGPDLAADYIDMDAARGQDVRAVHEGKVLFADYQKGRGNLIIVDHGNGYWSVYGHVDELFKSKGATVAAGERIATVGDTGGRPRPGLYFQLLRNSKPLDPRPWFKTSTPPSG